MIVSFNAKLCGCFVILLILDKFLISEEVLLSDFIKVRWDFSLGNIKHNLTSTFIDGIQRVFNSCDYRVMSQILELNIVLEIFSLFWTFNPLFSVNVSEPRTPLLFLLLILY